MIVKKEVSYLENKIKDLDWAYKQFGFIFDRGGKIGGGLPRRALFENGGSLKKSSRNFRSRKEIGIVNIFGLRKAMEKKALEKYMIANHHKFVDIDFFFDRAADHAHCIQTLKDCSDFHSSSGYANSFVFVRKEKKDFVFTKVQLVKRSISKQNDIEGIINDFDFINCMIAFDKDSVWFHKDFFEKNEKKILSCNVDFPPKRAFLRRVGKYLEFNDSIENHIIPTIRHARDGFDETEFFRLLAAGKFMTKDDLLCLYGTCGRWAENMNKFIRFSLDYDTTRQGSEEYLKLGKYLEFKRFEKVLQT